MDIPDDWGQESNLDLYETTYDAAMEFASAFPDTLWCAGNHDMSYLWNGFESGYSIHAEDLARNRGIRLFEKIGNNGAFIHRIDNVLFMHGGLSEGFVRYYVKSSSYNDVDKVIEVINSLHKKEMWVNDSTIWLRPQYGQIRMYKPRKLLQVVGHTPVESITRKGNVISCDTFSTFRDGTPIGPRQFLLIDTKTWEFSGIS